MLVFVVAVIAFYLIYRRYLSIEKVVSAEIYIRESYSNQPAFFLAVAFVIYVLATGLSLPISTGLSLSYAWILGWFFETRGPAYSPVVPRSPVFV